MKALEKDRTRRYQSAREFAQDIGRYLDGELLNRSREQVLNDADMAPLTKVELLGAIAKSYEGLGLYQSYLELERKSLDLLLRQSAQPAEIAEAKLKVSTANKMADGDFNESLQLSREALATFLEELGPADEKTVDAMDQLAMLLAVANELEKTSDRLAEAKRLFDQIVGTVDPDENSALLIEVSFGRALIAIDEGQYAKVVEICNEALANEKLDPEMRCGFLRLKMSPLISLGLMDQAVENSQQLVTNTEVHVGRHHVDFADAMSKLGQAQTYAGLRKQAEESFQIALEVGVERYRRTDTAFEKPDRSRSTDSSYSNSLGRGQTSKSVGSVRTLPNVA